MKIIFNEKEYSIKFGYKATLKSGIMKKLVETDDGNELEAIEKTLLLIPELLVVGLQVHHSDEFGYNLDTNEGYEEQVNKAFDMVEAYLENKDNSVMFLYKALEQELVNDSFLSSLFQAEKNKAEQKTQKKTQKN